MSLALYLITTVALVVLWSRGIQRISVAAAIALVLLPAVFTGRALFTSRVYAPIDLPFQYEPLRAHAAAYGVATPHEPRLSDLHAQMIPWQKAVRYALAEGEWPLWNPFILSGDILAAAAQPAVYDPVNWLALVLPLPQALTFGASMTFFFAAFFTFVFARSIGVGEGGALVSASAFAFCAMLAFYVGWPLGRAWALMPLVLVGVRRVVDGRKWGMFAAALSLLVVAGHPESVLHVVLVGVLYGISIVRNVRPIALALLAGVVSLGVTAVYLLPFLEAAPQTVEHALRKDLYAKKPYAALITPQARNERVARSFLPWIKGDPLSTRVGFFVLLLAACARKRRAWFFAGLALAGFLVACGIPPLPHLLHALPLFDITINERLAFAGSFGLAMLAGIGADRWPRAIPLMLAIVLAERVLEDGRIYPAIEERAFYPKVISIPREGDLFRIAGTWATFVPNISAMYELEDVRGYEAMTFRRYAQTYPLWSRYQHAFFNLVEDPSRPFLSFLNVRYILEEGRVTTNPNALPRAFVPPRIRVEHEDAVVDQMSRATDFAGLAWIESESDEPHERANGPGRVAIHRKGLGYELQAAMEADGWIVVSESAWKGWRAYIDGRRVRTQFANHAFLGLFVPAGRHEIRLVYLPESFTRGRAISLITIGLLLLGTLARACRRSSSTSSSPSPSF
jgi:hypothetical protein